jgi:hypothetical protein
MLLLRSVKEHFWLTALRWEGPFGPLVSFLCTQLDLSTFFSSSDLTDVTGCVLPNPKVCVSENTPRLGRPVGEAADAAPSAGRSTPLHLVFRWGMTMGELFGGKQCSFFSSSIGCVATQRVYLMNEVLMN